MNILKTQLHVLRQLCYWRPHAHLAFLAYKPYRAQYNNAGQNRELCERLGRWIYMCDLYYEYGPLTIVAHCFPFNNFVYHPLVSHIHFLDISLQSRILTVYFQIDERDKYKMNETTRHYLKSELFDHTPRYAKGTQDAEHKTVCYTFELNVDCAKQYNGWTKVFEYIKKHERAPRTLEEFFL